MKDIKSNLGQGCVKVLSILAGIIFLGFILNFAINRDKKHEADFPWRGSVWYIYENSSPVFGSEQFKTLDECREWAYDRAKSKDLKEGGWDYSCGTNCTYTDQTIEGGKKINKYECVEVTK